MATEFNPDLQLSGHEQGALAMTIASEGWKVAQSIMRNEVDKFVLVLLNTETTDEKAILDAHRNAKLTAMLLEGIVRRISHEVDNYVSSRPNVKPIGDITENILDIGAPASTQEEYDQDLSFSEEGILDE